MLVTKKIIGKSLNAKVTFVPNDEVTKLLASIKADLKQIFIVSEFNVVTEDIDATTYDSGKIKVEAAVGETCSRCWQIVPSLNPDELCPRCAKILKH